MDKLLEWLHLNQYSRELILTATTFLTYIVYQMVLMPIRMIVDRYKDNRDEMPDYYVWVIMGLLICCIGINSMIVVWVMDTYSFMAAVVVTMGGYIVGTVTDSSTRIRFKIRFK